jgi:hypothetical protein
MHLVLTKNGAGRHFGRLFSQTNLVTLVCSTDFDANFLTSRDWGYVLIVWINPSVWRFGDCCCCTFFAHGNLETEGLKQEWPFPVRERIYEYNPCWTMYNIGWKVMHICTCEASFLKQSSRLRAQFAPMQQWCYALVGAYAPVGAYASFKKLANCGATIAWRTSYLCKHHKKVPQWILHPPEEQKTRVRIPPW